MKHKFENNKNYGKVSYKLYLKKGEFETEELFKERVEKHIALRRAYIKNITDSMKTLVKPYGNFSNLRKTYNAKKSKTVSNENESVYFDTYSPRLKNYLSSTIKEFRYNAELEYFTLKVYFNSSSKRKAGEKRYKIYVPLKDAEKFKKEREKHQYLFFLQDLRAVITGNKVYQIAPIYTWYIELACDKGVEESVLLINGKQSKKDIAEYIKSEVTNHPDFIKRAKDLLKLYKDRLNMTSSTSTFEVYFDEKGRYSNLDINHSTRVYLKSYEEYHRQEFNLEVEMKEILKAKDIRIKPRKNKCKAIRDSFRFEYTIRN